MSYKNIDKWQFFHGYSYIYFICYIEEVVFWIIYKGDLHIQMYRSTKSQGSAHVLYFQNWTELGQCWTRSKAGQNAILESPTGTGKTLCLLTGMIFLYSVTPTGISDLNRNRLLWRYPIFCIRFWRLKWGNHIVTQITFTLALTYWYGCN